MEKKDFIEVLTHQTQGIMFHSEMVMLLCFLNKRSESFYQKHQMAEETDNYFCTMQYYIDTFNELPKITDIREGISLYESDIPAPSTQAEREDWYEKAIDAWVEWEEETLELYNKMLNYDVNNRFWHKMVKCVPKELDLARKIQSRYTFRNKDSVAVADNNTMESFSANLIPQAAPVTPTVVLKGLK